jgi:hypothetical protein
MAKETEFESVTMNDGRVVDFAGKQRCKVDTKETEAGLYVQLDFKNGESRVFKMRTDMVPLFALHGAKQKLVDEMAGIKDLDDAILAVDELVERLDNGEWSIKRASGEGIAGTSVLLRALVEYTGKSVAEVKARLKDMSQTEKMAMRANAKLKPIIERMEQEKAGRSNVDTDGLLEQFAA